MNESQPEALVKFLDSGSALRALEKSELDWTAPHSGEDLFALDANSTISFDLRALLQAAGRAIAAAVFARQPPAGVPGHPMTNVVRRWRAQRRFNSEDEVLRALRTVLPGMAERQIEDVQQILADWRALAARVRVLRLYERHTDPGLWQRLADHHRGIALRIACDEGTSLWQPHAVRYQSRRPQITTLQEQVEVLLGQTRHVAQEHFRERLLTRSRADAEEREWRCFRHYESGADGGAAAGDDDTPASEQVNFKVSEVRAIYLGARMSSANRERVVAIAAERYPAARLFQAEPSAREFVLDFSDVGGNADDPEADAEREPGQPQAPLAQASA